MNYSFLIFSMKILIIGLICFSHSFARGPEMRVDFFEEEHQIPRSFFLCLKTLAPTSSCSDRCNIKPKQFLTWKTYSDFLLRFSHIQESYNGVQLLCPQTGQALNTKDLKINLSMLRNRELLQLHKFLKNKPMPTPFDSEKSKKEWIKNWREFIHSILKNHCPSLMLKTAWREGYYSHLKRFNGLLFKCYEEVSNDKGCLFDGAGMKEVPLPSDCKRIEYKLNLWSSPQCERSLGISVDTLVDIDRAKEAWFFIPPELDEIEELLTIPKL
jgi:hypothetical protein